MRRLVSLAPALAVSLSSACVRDNPAFDDCPVGDDCLAEDSSTGDPNTGDGDGDPGTGDGDGDGDPNTGDGDGDPETGDGDGDSETGDGDGDGELPTCPELAEVDIPVVQDTFLDGSGANEQLCALEWNYLQNAPGQLAQVPCAGLDFGGAPSRWACGGGTCNSTYLAEFAVADWQEAQPKVGSADLIITARIKNAEQAQVEVRELHPLDGEFEGCGEWMAGEGNGTPPSMCVTTYTYAAYPDPWNILVAPLDPPISTVKAPLSPDAALHEIVLPLSADLVNAWILGETAHHGLLVRTDAWLPPEFNLLAQGSESPPRLRVKMCSP
jgi:hypothetical protein